MNPQKTILNGQEYEFVAAEVIEVDYDGVDKEKLYSIQCKILSSHGSQSPFDLVTARALDANIKNIPIAGEVVLITKGPTAYNSMRKTGQEYYYTNPISIQSSVHHNGIPGVTEVIPVKNPNNQKSRTGASDGVPLKKIKDSSIKTTIHRTFPERLDVYPIQPYSGDIILEGRWGQSIRFGSTVDNDRIYPVPPLWKKGLGDTGNPILIISNGTNPEKKPINEFISENPNEDDSSIWMTSGQEVRFTPASTATTSIKSKSVDLFNKNNFSGNQVIVASDRLIFNARKQEIIAFAKEGIGLSSQKAVSIDAGQVVEMESARINLGVNALSPVLLGDRTMTWLNNLCSTLLRLTNAILELKVPTGVGPSGTPINAPTFIKTRAELNRLKTDIEKLQSRLVFLNEKSNGPSGDAVVSSEKQKEIDDNRIVGQEPPRETVKSNDISISYDDPRKNADDIDLETGQYSGEGGGLGSMRNPLTGEYYGKRDIDAKTWLYDKRYDDFITKYFDSLNGNSTGDVKFDDSQLKDSSIATGTYISDVYKTPPEPDKKVELVDDKVNDEIYTVDTKTYEKLNSSNDNVGTSGTSGTTGTGGTTGTSGTSGTTGTPSTGSIDIYLDISSGTPNLPDLTQTIGNSDKYYTDVISDFLKNLPNNYLINFNSYLSNETIIRYKVTLLGDKSASENNTTVNTFANSVVSELTNNGLSTNNVYPPNITVTSGTNNNGSYLWFSVRIVVL